MNYNQKDPYEAQTSPSSQNSPPDAGKMLGSIDQAASPSSQNSPEDPGKMITSIDLANHGGINSFNNVSYEAQCPGSTCTFTDNSFNDDVAQYNKGDLGELNRIRNQAFNSPVPPTDSVPLIGRQDSDPKGG